MKAPAVRVIVFLQLVACAQPRESAQVGDDDADRDNGEAGGDALGGGGGASIGDEASAGGGGADDAHDEPFEADASPPEPDAVVIDARPAPPVSPVFVAIGNGGYRATSFDGIKWQDKWLTAGNAIEAKENFRGIGYGAGTFLAVGGAFGENILMRSSDGIEWETVAAPGFGGLYDAAYQDGVWVIVGGSADRGYSADDGKTWKRTGENVGAHFRMVAGGAGLFVAVGNSWDKPARGISTVSSDLGRSWSKPRYTNDGEIRGVAHGAGVFVTVSRRVCEVSANGLDWQECGARLQQEFSGVYFVNGQFVIVARDGGKGLQSADGKAWTATPGSIPSGSISFAGGVYVVVQWGARYHSTKLGDFKRLPGDFRPCGSVTSNGG